MKAKFPALSNAYVRSIHLSDDGVIGIPVTLSLYTYTDATRISPLVQYVIGTNTERIGTESDEAILSDLVREYITVVIDYHNDTRACGLLLDYSLHHLRRRIIDEKFVVGERRFYRDADNWILPAGYRLLRKYPYYNFRDHAPDGILDYIVKIWNEDFTETRGARRIDLPDGNITFVRDVHPTTPEECLRPDGRPIDLNLYLDILYPSMPREGTSCPVSACAASRQSTTGNWVMAHYPGYLNSQLFSGYAVLLYEFPYVPMARTDHYGYFPDGPSYKLEHCDRHHGMGFYTGIHSSVAAIRTFRYLCHTRPELCGIDSDRIGLSCISKTGYNYALATPHPETLPEKRYLEGHLGECQKKQPALTYPDGTPIPANVQAMYSVAGTGEYFVRDGMAPVMTTQGEHDSYHFYREVTANARERDEQCLFFVVPDLGHAMSYGYDPARRLDMYRAVLDFMDTHLKCDYGECEYMTPNDGSTLPYNPEITLHFTGAVEREEIERAVSVTDLFGRRIPARISASYGDSVYTLRPVLPYDARPVTVTVPEGLRFKNGAKTSRALTYTYRTPAEHPLATLVADGDLLDGEHTVTFAPVTLERSGSERILLRFGVAEPAAQTVGVYMNGRRIASASVGGVGVYSVDLTDLVPLWTEITLTLRAEDAIGERAHLHADFTTGEGYTLTLGEGATASHVTAPDGTPALSITLDPYHYTTARGYRLRLPLSESGWRREDFGRMFRISARLMSPSDAYPRGTYLSVAYNRDASSHFVDTDHRAHRLVHPEHTPGEWVDATVLYHLDREEYLCAEVDKREVDITHDDGMLLISRLEVSEIRTPVRLCLGKDGTPAPAIVLSGLSHG